jgi:hypothetical protein
VEKVPDSRLRLCFAEMLETYGPDENNNNNSNNNTHVGAVVTCNEGDDHDDDDKNDDDGCDRDTKKKRSSGSSRIGVLDTTVTQHHVSIDKRQRISPVQTGEVTAEKEVFDQQPSDSEGFESEIEKEEVEKEEKRDKEQVMEGRAAECDRTGPLIAAKVLSTAETIARQSTGSGGYNDEDGAILDEMWN